MKLQATAISAKGWNSSRPAESFRSFASHIHNMAKEVLMKDGHHSEMFFFMPLDGNGHIILWHNNDRDLEADWLRQHITEHYIYGVVHVVEGWMHMADKPGDHTLKQIMAGEIKVSELKPEHRREVLMVSAQSRDGWATSWVDRMMRNPAGRISLGGCTEFDDFRGRFGKVFG
jgi:hypothetical protein